MQFSSKLTRRGRLARLATLTAAAALIGGLAGCGGADDSVPLLRTSIKIESITQQGQCEDVNVKVTPLKILPGAPKLSNSREFVTPVKLTKGTDGVSCTGSAQTIPMSPGKWKFTANLPSQIAMCERDVTGGVSVAFKDAETTCS